MAACRDPASSGAVIRAMVAHADAAQGRALALSTALSCLGDVEHDAALSRGREHPERQHRVLATLLAGDALAACMP
jgi:hypothetical protein